MHSHDQVLGAAKKACRWSQCTLPMQQDQHSDPATTAVHGAVAYCARRFSSVVDMWSV